MSDLNHQAAAELLTEAYPWQKFEFMSQPGTETWACRYLISCILVAGSLESRTIACGKELFTKYPDLYSLEKAEFRELTDLIDKYELRFAGKKAGHIIETAAQLRHKHNGRVPDERAKLERLPGVGRHVASVILATVYGQNEFAVDVHVRRIAKRLGLADEKASDRRIEKIIVEAVTPEMLGHFSRSFVDHGQQICAFTPKCGQCYLQSQCPSANGKQPKPVVQTVVDGAPLEDGSFEFKNDRGDIYIVKVEGSKPNCTCKGWRYKKTCKHVDSIKEKSKN